MSNNQSEDSTARCLTYEERPTTPHSVRKYRKSYFADPGQRVTHFGSIDDESKLRERIKDKRLGSHSTDSAHVQDVFSHGESDSILEYEKERRESIYKTAQREPLGKPYIRGHEMPAPRRKPNAAYSATKTSKCEAKELIYSSPLERDLEQKQVHKEQYIKSHNSYEPGEQKCRKYDWKKVDPQQHRFGIVEARNQNEGVGFCLKPETSTDNKRLTSLAVQNFRNVNSHSLGQPRNRGMVPSADGSQCEQVHEHLKAMDNFRRQRPVHPDWTAEQCIRGAYSINEQQPDKDLGKATRPGWRNAASMNRTFGCPTVRNDIKAPTRRSISDNQNYGDDTNAAKLLYPSRFTTLGVDDNDFVQPREKQQAREMFANIGYTLSDEQFEKIYSQALATGDYVQGDQVSVHDLRTVLNHMLDLADEGKTPEWW